MPIDPQDFPVNQPLRSQAPDELQDSLQSVGSVIETFLPDNSNNKKAIRRGFSGQGVIIVSGAEIALDAGQGVMAPPYPEITFVTFKDGPEATGLTEERRTFQKGEMYDGAVLFGEFDAIEVNWSSTVAPTPLKLRIIEGPNRVVPVHTGELHVSDRVIDWQCKSLTMVKNTQTLLYDDTDPGLWLGAGYSGTGGVGNSFRPGLHRSIKRRLHGMVHTEDSNHPNPDEHFYILITALNESDGTETFWWIGQSQTRIVESQGFTACDDCEIVRFGHMNAAQDIFNVDTQGVAVPPRFKIYGLAGFTTTPATFHMHLWFTGI